MERFVARIWKSGWDRWLPLSVVVLFVAAGVSVAVADAGLGIPAGDVDRFHILYTEIGIQTTAGIFAIIISLSLVAIQFAAQEYSHRIMEYYIRSTVFWTTIVVYLGVIVAGIVLQMRATDADDTRMAAVLLVGVVLALALLIPHFLITAAYLKPEFVVGKLMGRLNSGYVRGIARQGVPGPASDRLLPIVEIIERAIDRGDVTTMRGAMDRVVGTYQTTAAPLAAPAVDGYFLAALLRAGRKAIAQPEEQQAGVLAMEGVAAIANERNTATVIDALEELGFAALRRDGELVVASMVRKLAAIAESSGDAALQARVMATFGELSHRLVAADHRRLLSLLSTVVVEAGASAMATGDRERAADAVQLLEDIGHDCAAAQMSVVVEEVARGLQRLGTAMASQDRDAAQAVALALLRIERTVPRGERRLLATIGFARSEIERLAGERTPSDVPAVEAVDGDPLGLSDLWGEAKD